MSFTKPSRDSHLEKHATMPANERGKRSQPTDDDPARWMWLADVALRNSAGTDEVADIEAPRPQGTSRHQETHPAHCGAGQAAEQIETLNTSTGHNCSD